jgi:predicted RecA/RadA family phage recombinase
MKAMKLMILAVAAMVQSFRGLHLAANTYDAAVEVHDETVRRTNDAAVTTRHLLWKQGSTDNGVAICAAANVPLGTIDNEETGTGKGVTIKLLGKGPTKKMVALAAIAAGARVYTAAGGKVQTAPTGATVSLVGVALTAAANADEIIEVNDCAPVSVTFA